ncbi:MAG TPA: NGG1p interacting factor NIF3 [bacterium]|nr:NGG1p interacting factor NIF3 [bacterium]
MKLEKIYRLAVEKGMANDPRGKREVEKVLKRIRKEYDKSSKEEKRDFDLEKLTHPYSDTRILYGDPNGEVKTLLAGIDIGEGELLLADRLRAQGKKIDLSLSHHPAGRAYASFYEVMGMQAQILSQYGIPINVAEDLLEPRIKEVERKVLPVNHMRAVDMARLLDIPFLCIHTPADNMVATYLKRIMDKEKPDTVEEVMEILKRIPEYKESFRNNAGPKVIIGKKGRSAGKIFVDMTGGTEGSEKIFEKLSTAGVGTIVGMHISEKHYKEAEKHHINIIVAGHMASDTLGLNLLLDEIEKKERLKIIPCSGFRRYKHKK